MLSVAQLGPILFSSKFTTSELSKSNRRIAGSRASDGSNDNWDLNPPTHLLSHEWNLSAQQLGRRLEKVRKEFGVVFVDAKLLSRYFVPSEHQFAYFFANRYRVLSLLLSKWI